MNSATAFAFVMVTAPNMTAARKVATAALKEKLVACANLIPKMESHYWWQGALESSSEVLMLFKTTDSALVPLEKLIIANHPYDTPEVVVLRLDQGNEKYLNWIASSVKTS